MGYSVDRECATTTIIWFLLLVGRQSAVNMFVRMYLMLLQEKVQELPTFSTPQIATI